MKKIVACLLVAAIVLGIAAAFILNTPDFMLFRMVQDVRQEGLTAAAPYLTGNLQPLFQTAVELSRQPWMMELLGSDSTQVLVSLLSAEGAIAWKLEDMRRGSTTASCLVSAETSAFAAQIGLEMVREEGKWLISGFTLPAFDLK